MTTVLSPIGLDSDSSELCRSLLTCYSRPVPGVHHLPLTARAVDPVDDRYHPPASQIFLRRNLPRAPCMMQVLSSVHRTARAM